MRLKARLNSVLRSRGLTLVSDWEADELYAARHLRKLMELYKVDCVLDVGANPGQFRDFAVSAGWLGPVISFEPVSTYYEAIASRASGTWKCFRYALGNENCEKQISVFDSPGLASIRAADIESMNAFLPRGSVRQVRSETVTVRRVADVFAEVAGSARRVLLKIDTQGYDLEVFRGAAEVLDKICVLWAEVSFLPIYENAPAFAETISEFGTRGFQVSGMFPVTLDKSLRAVEFDCALVRANALTAT